MARINFMDEHNVLRVSSKETKKERDLRETKAILKRWDGFDDYFNIKNDKEEDNDYSWYDDMLLANFLESCKAMK